MRREIAVRCPASRSRRPAISDSVPVSFGNFKGFKSKSSGDDADVAEPAPTRLPPRPPPFRRPRRSPPPPPSAPRRPQVPRPPRRPRWRPSRPRHPSRSKPAPAPAAAPITAPQPAPVAAAPARPTTPLGIWATEENKGNVRIEECGQNLCGYAVKTGKKILINMKPQASKWTGTIHDPDSGRNYRLDHRDEGHQRAAGSGLRLRRHVLRRPDLEARQLKSIRPSKSPRGFSARAFCWRTAQWLTIPRDGER